VVELIEMGSDRHPGEITHPCEILPVGRIEDVGDGSVAGLDGRQHALFAVEAVPKQPLARRPWLLDGGAVARIEAFGGQRSDAPKRGEIRPHVSLGSPDDDAPLGDGEVADEKRLPGGKGDVFGRVSGGTPNDDRPVARRDFGSVPERSIRSHSRRVGERRLAAVPTPHRRVGRLGTGGDPADVIRMVVGDGNVGDPIELPLQTLVRGGRIDEEGVRLPPRRRRSSDRRALWSRPRSERVLSACPIVGFRE